MATPNQNQTPPTTPARITQLLSQIPPPPPPPPYSPTTATTPSSHLTTSTTLTTTATKPPTPHPSITIKIDASVNIQGHFNHCYLPAALDTQRLTTLIVASLKHIPEADGKSVDLDVRNTYAVSGSRNLVMTGGSPAAAALLAKSVRNAGVGTGVGGETPVNGEVAAPAVNGGSKEAAEAGTKRKADEVSESVME